MSATDAVSGDQHVALAVGLDEGSAFESEPELVVGQGQSVEESARGGLGPALWCIGPGAGAADGLLIVLERDRAAGVQRSRTRCVEGEQHQPLGILGVRFVICDLEGHPWKLGGFGAQLGDADDAAIDEQTEGSTECALDVAHDLLGVQLMTGEDVNLRETTGVVDDNASRHDAGESGEQPLDFVLLDAWRCC